MPTVCELCGAPMPPGEEMFKYHGFSGPCPKPPLKKQPLLSREATEQAHLLVIAALARRTGGEIRVKDHELQAVNVRTIVIFDYDHDQEEVVIYTKERTDEDGQQSFDRGLRDVRSDEPEAPSDESRAGGGSTQDEVE